MVEPVAELGRPDCPAAIGMAAAAVTPTSAHRRWALGVRAGIISHVNERAAAPGALPGLFEARWVE